MINVNLVISDFLLANVSFQKRILKQESKINFSLECRCNSQGSENNQCNDLGKCLCKANVHGHKCDECQDGRSGFPRCSIRKRIPKVPRVLKKAKKEIEKLKSQSSGLAGQLKPLDSFKKDVAALVESLYEECKETYGNNPQCMLRNYRGRLVKSRCENVRRVRLNWINKIAKHYRILEKPFCIERKPYIRP